MPKKPLRIAIIGAGVGGLTLAHTIGKHSTVPIDLYESGPHISTVGAGISVWKRTLEVLELLGLADKMRARGISLDGKDQQRVYARTNVAQHLNTYRYNFLTDAVPKGGLTMHRTHLIDLLKDSLPSTCSVHLSKRFTTYDALPDGSLELHFSDGTAAPADVLVGADGVRSATRAKLFKTLADEYPDGLGGNSREELAKCVEPVWSGTVAYRCVFPAEKLRVRDPEHRGLEDQLFGLGKDRHIVSYPIAQRTLINFIGFDTIKGGEGTHFNDKWVKDVPVQDFRDLYRGWEPEMQTLLACADTPSRWAIHVTAPLPFYSHGPVALLGDAAHAMTTHFGAGAGQAIESAYILGCCLAHERTARANIPDVLKIYSGIRQPFANGIVEKSRVTGLIYEFAWPGLYDGVDRAREAERLVEIGRAIKEQFAWVSENGLEADWTRAEQKLSGLGNMKF